MNKKINLKEIIRTILGIKYLERGLQKELDDELRGIKPKDDIK